jgi:hypothetical protein
VIVDQGRPQPGIQDQKKLVEKDNQEAKVIGRQNVVRMAAWLVADPQLPECK